MEKRTTRAEWGGHGCRWMLDSQGRPLRWWDLSKGVKEANRLACGYLGKSSRYREQSLQRPQVGMCLVCFRSSRISVGRMVWLRRKRFIVYFFQKISMAPRELLGPSYDCTIYFCNFLAVDFQVVFEVFITVTAKQWIFLWLCFFTKSKILP